MTITVGQPDLLQEIKRMDQRIYDLEQGRGGITYDSNGAPVFKRGMTIGDDDPIYVDEPVPPPTDLTLSWGSFYENIFITAEWTAPTGPGSSQVNQYEAELTEVGVGVIQSQVVGGNSARFNGLKPNQQYSVRVRSINRLSRSSSYTSPQTITTGTDATIPAQVQNVQAGAGQKTMTVWWDENTEEDVRFGHGGYECELSTSATFLTTFRTIRTTGTIVSFGDLVTGTTYYARVRAFDSSGNFGPFSLTVSATPGKAQGGDIENGAVCDDHVCASGISAAHIKFGTMEGDRIQTNTLDANRIKTSSLDAQTITIAGSGMFRIGRTTSPFHYMLQDSAGIRFYQNGSAAFTGGTLAVDLNVTTGGATFKGNIDASTITGSTITGGTFRTAASGNRVEMSSAAPDDIKFFTGNASETTSGIIDTLDDGTFLYTQYVSPRKSSGGFARLQLGASGSSSAFNLQARSASLTRSFIYGDQDGEIFIQSHNASGTAVTYLTLDNALLQMVVGSNLRMEADSTDINLWANTHLNDFRLVFRAPGDALNVARYTSTHSGPELVGDPRPSMKGGDFREIVDGAVNIGKSMNAAASGHREHEAAPHTNISDPSTKAEMMVTKLNALSLLKATPIYDYRSKQEVLDNPNAPVRLGFDASLVPAPCQADCVVRDNTAPGWSKTKTIKGIRTDAMDAWLGKSIQDLAAVTDENRAKINQIISALPAVNRPAPLN